MSESEQPQGNVQVPKAWKAPALETLKVASTEGGPAPKNNENV